MQHNHGAISLAIKCFDLTKPGRRTKDKIDGPRSFPWFVLRSHASSSLRLDRTRRTAFNDCFGLDKKEGTPFHRKRSSNLFSLPPSLSFSLSDDAAAAAIGHPSCVAKTELKATLYRAPLRTSGLRTNRIISFFTQIPLSFLLQLSKTVLPSIVTRGIAITPHPVLGE